MFSRTCEYALRAIRHVAEHDNEGPVLAKEIADETEIPLRYLQKVLRELVRVGVLSSTRGIGGGFKLTRAPQSITLADVMAPFDEVVARQTTCPFGFAECQTGTPCPIHHKWDNLRIQYTELLTSTTVQDVVRSECNVESGPQYQDKIDSAV